jgi:CxxC motif-containing protein
MEKRELVCICCPIGCHLEVELEGSSILSVKGEGCKRGAAYGAKECSNPTRVLTTSVEVLGGYPEVASVKTETDIPKDKLFDCIKELKKIRLTAPVKVGDVVATNIAGTGVRIIATKNCEALKS